MHGIFFRASQIGPPGRHDRSALRCVTLAHTPDRFRSRGVSPAGDAVPHGAQARLSRARGPLRKRRA